MPKIGPQDGITAEMNRLRDLDPGGTKLVKGADGKWLKLDQLTIPLDAWGAIDKLQRTLQILHDDHDGIAPAPPNPNPDPPDPPDETLDDSDLEPARARIFLAWDPLQCVRAGAPQWMVPVVSADPGLEGAVSDDVVYQLRNYFGRVEAWCDCRPDGGTSYQTCLDVVNRFGLDGAWGQSENQSEFDHAVANGATRTVGNLAALNDTSRALIRDRTVLHSNELYRNVQPWQLPDWRDCASGVGGNCIACYGSSSENASYYPVSRYKAEGFYIPHYDSVYGVGLTDQDWKDLA